MENINISYDFFSSIKIISEELIKYLKNYKLISVEHLKQLKLLDNNTNIKLEDKKILPIINIICKIKGIIKQNINLIKCSIEDMDSYINDLENNLKLKTEMVTELKKSSLNLTNNLKSSYQEVTKTGNIYISSLSKTEDIINDYYINKIKIRDHENGLGSKLNINEYNIIKEQQKLQLSEMNNLIQLTKKYEEFHKGAISASNKLYNEFIEESNLIRNKIKENICLISQKIKENILFFLISFKRDYNQSLDLVKNYIDELYNLDINKEINNIIDQNLDINNSLKKSEPIKYKLKSLQFLKDINYIKNEEETNDDTMNKKIINIEIARKAIKALNDDFCQLYYISDDSLMLTIKTIFENYDFIEKENFDIKKEESKNKTQRYIMKIIENININTNETIKRNELSNDEIIDLVDLLNEHDNRIIFLQKLSDFRVKGKYILPEKDYIILSQLFNILCENIKKYSDYHSAELVIILSHTYYTIHKNEKRYLQKTIKENIIFKEKNFWEEYLCYAINKEIMKMLKIDEKIQEDKKVTDYKYSNIVFTQILAMIDNMFEFNLDINIVKEVLEPKINVYRLNGDLKATIKEVIKSKETDLKIEDENKNI